MQLPNPLGHRVIGHEALWPSVLGNCIVQEFTFKIYFLNCNSFAFGICPTNKYTDGNILHDF